MKTVQQWYDEFITKKQNKTKENQDKSQEILTLTKDIPIYKPEAEYDSCNYEIAKERTREEIKNGFGKWINLCCDTCQTPLCDIDPGLTLASNPPQFRAHCCGCGRVYGLPLEARGLEP